MFDGDFKAISDRHRRYLLEQLLVAPRTVNELAANLPISRPAVSQHLKILRDADLVSVVTRGTLRIYAINAVGFEDLRDWVVRFNTTLPPASRRRPAENARLP